MTDLSHPAAALLRRILHPDDLGHAVSAEVRQHAAACLSPDHAPPARVLYIAGPMSGLAHHNHPAFLQAEETLRAAGYAVLNPARNGLPHDALWHRHMRRDLGMLLACAGVALIPGWERSRGVRLEVAWADALDIPVRGLDDWIAPGDFS